MSPAASAFANAAVAPVPFLFDQIPQPAPVPTPYTALFLELQMRDDIEAWVRAVHSPRDGTLIPLCRYGANPEPPAHIKPAIAVAAVNDVAAGLQILLITINGQTHRKDGVPYHVIWSVDQNKFPRDEMVADKNVWPVQTISNMKHAQHEDGRYYITYELEKEFVQYTRVLSVAEKAAEELALRTQKHCANKKSFIDGNLEFLALDIPLQIAPPVGKDRQNSIDESACIRPQVHRVEYSDSGQRMANFMTW